MALVYGRDAINRGQEWLPLCFGKSLELYAVSYLCMCVHRWRLFMLCCSTVYVRHHFPASPCSLDLCLV